MKSNIDQLYDIYCTHPWENNIPKNIIDSYHRILINRGNLIYETDGENVVGYVETLKITPEQFGRMILNRVNSFMEEDTLNGDVAVVSNVWIHSDYRNGWVIKNMEKRFFEFTKDCKEFCGFAWRKKHQPIKVFKRDKLIEFIENKLGVIHGR